MASERARRPFWLHQVAEYLIGLALVGQGLQGPEPLVPAVMGGLVVLNAATVHGPLGAFRLVGRATHRILDVVVIVLVAASAVQPWVSVDAGSRLILGVIALVLGFVWFYTDYAERASRRERRMASAGPRSEDIGRGAGRLAGGAVRELRRRRDR